MSDQPVAELDNQLRGVLIISGCVLAGLVFLILLFPGKTFLWGMVIGLITGMYNSITLVKRIKRLPELHPDSAKRHMRVSLAFRLGLIMAVLFFVSRQVPWVSLLGVGAGILIPSYIAVTLSVVESYRLYRSENLARKAYGKE